MTRRRLLFLLPFPPRLDANHGGARAAANIIAGLAARHDVAVLYVRPHDEPPMDAALRARCTLVEEVPGGRPAGMWGNARRAARLLIALAGGLPWWPALLASTAVASRARRLAREWRPDVVHLELMAMGQFAHALADDGAPMVLTAYEPYAEAAVERALEARGVERLLARLALARWHRYEREVARRVDAIVAFTTRDQRVLERITPDPAKVALIPLGMALPTQALDPVGASPAEVLFVGNFVHPPNRDAALRLIRDIAPRVWQRVPDARIVIVGPNPPGELQAPTDARVLIMGEVPDVAPYLARAAVVAAPLRLGGGTRVKVLEAIAAGKAVVATPRALEGIDVEDGVQVRVADDDARFAEAIVQLLERPGARASLGAAARAWASDAFGTGRWLDDYDRLYERLRRPGSRVDVSRGETPQGEPSVDAVVRSADWRFLLHGPANGRHRRLVVLGAPPALVRGIASIGLADEVLDRLPDDRSASAIVVLPGAPVVPRAFSGALAPGGALYVEVNRRSRSGARWSARRLARALRDCGLVPGPTYLVGRRGLAPRRYVPIDTPAPALWLLRSAFCPVTPMERVAGAGLAALLRAKLHRSLLHPLLPHYAMTATVPGSAAIPSVLAGLAPALDAGAAAQVVLFGDGGDRVVAMRFGEGDTAPSAVLKVPRGAGLRGRTEHEQACMRELRASLPAELARAIPEPLGIVSRDDVYAATESALPGRMLLASTGRWGASIRRRLADLDLATDWLARFHLATTLERRSWGERETEGWVVSFFARYSAAYGELPEERALLSATLAHARRLAGIHVPVVWQHRDFAVWNLARSGDSLAVLDWEGARVGPPLVDMLHLVTSWDLAIRRPSGDAAQIDNLHALFLGENRGDPYVVAARAAIARYMTRLSLDPALLPLLLVHHRVELAVRRAEQVADQGHGATATRIGNVWVGAVERLAGSATPLFPPHASP